MRLRVPFSGSAFKKSVFATAILCLSCLSVDGVAQDATKSNPAGHSPTLARVFAAWNARQERVKSFHFVWDRRIVLPRGAFRFPRERRPAGMWTVDDFEGDKNLEVMLPRYEWWGEGPDRLRSDFGGLSTTARADGRRWRNTDSLTTAA